MASSTYASLPRVHLRNFTSVHYIPNSRLVRTLRSTCRRYKASRAVIIAHSGGQTGVCGGNVQNEVLKHRRRLSKNSRLVVTGGGCC